MMSEKLRIHSNTSISEVPFGQLNDGTQITEYRLENDNNLTISVLNYGGILHSIITPDRKGKLSDIVLGYDDLAGYLQDKSYMGAIIGRYANRIAGASFVLDGITHHLSSNDGSNCHHGGVRGFNQAVWDAEVIRSNNEVALVLHHLSPDGDQGFPGNLAVSVSYILNQQNELNVRISAHCDQKTIVNISLHPYFNLSGIPGVNIGNHSLMIHAEDYLPITDSMIPTGEKRSVSLSSFDFRDFTPLGSRISKKDSQLELAGGFDHSFVRSGQSHNVREMAVLKEPESGRRVTISSNAPGLQLYTGNYLNSSAFGKMDVPFKKWQAVCLEPQYFPNSPQETTFPSTILVPGDKYKHRITYKFDTVE